MSEEISRYETRRIERADVTDGFACGQHLLDDYFRRMRSQTTPRGSAAHTSSRAALTTTRRFH